MDQKVQGGSVPDWRVGFPLGWYEIYRDKIFAPWNKPQEFATNLTKELEARRKEGEFSQTDLVLLLKGHFDEIEWTPQKKLWVKSQNRGPPVFTVMLDYISRLSQSRLHKIVSYYTTPRESYSLVKRLVKEEIIEILSKVEASISIKNYLRSALLVSVEVPAVSIKDLEQLKVLAEPSERRFPRLLSVLNGVLLEEFTATHRDIILDNIFRNIDSESAKSTAEIQSLYNAECKRLSYDNQKSVEQMAALLQEGEVVTTSVNGTPGILRSRVLWSLPAPDSGQEEIVISTSSFLKKQKEKEEAAQMKERPESPDLLESFRNRRKW